MGDGQSGRRYLEFTRNYRTNPHSEPACIKVSYRRGPKRWAGIYWQNKANNWGDSPGADLSRYSRLTFWARGENGTELIEFKAGGISSGKTYQDSFSATTGAVPLTTHWQKYTIDLRGKDLSNVIGGFAFVASSADNSGGADFFLDDIQYE